MLTRQIARALAGLLPDCRGSGSFSQPCSSCAELTMNVATCECVLLRRLQLLCNTTNSLAMYNTGHVLVHAAKPENATRATLQTLAERLAGGAAENLASELPPHIAGYLLGHPDTEVAEEMTLHEFFQRVSEREGVDLPKSIHHARAVIDVLQEAVSPGQMQNIRAQLPDEWDPLFESGSEGEMDL